MGKTERKGSGVMQKLIEMWKDDFKIAKIKSTSYMHLLSLISIILMLFTVAFSLSLRIHLFLIESEIILPVITRPIFLLPLITIIMITNSNIKRYLTKYDIVDYYSKELMRGDILSIKSLIMLGSWSLIPLGISIYSIVKLVQVSLLLNLSQGGFG